MCVYVCEPEPLRQPECSDVCEKKCRGHAEQCKCQTAIQWDMEQHGDPARTHNALVLGGRRWRDRKENSELITRTYAETVGSRSYTYRYRRFPVREPTPANGGLHAPVHSSIFSNMSPSTRDDHLCTSLLTRVTLVANILYINIVIKSKET